MTQILMTLSIPKSNVRTRKDLTHKGLDQTSRWLWYIWWMEASVFEFVEEIRYCIFIVTMLVAGSFIMKSEIKK